MTRVLRWLGRGLAGLAGLVLMTVVGGFAASEAMIRWPTARPASTPLRLRLPADLMSYPFRHCYC